MAEVLDRGPVRVTITAGGRRADLALPGAVPVAELVPELARGLGLLDAETAHRGLTLLGLDGRTLAPSGGLRPQGVRDGSVLTLVVGAEPPPRRYDDPAEAFADDIARDLAGRGTALAYGTAAVAGGTLLGLAIGRGLPALDHGAAVSLASLLVGAVLARGLFPRLALALSGAPAGERAADARRAYAHLTALTVAAGVVLTGAAPVVAMLGRWGLGLAAVACLAVLAGAVRAHGRRVARSLDLLEATLLAALLPLLALAGGLLDRLPG